jgi:hypothetical protein
MRLTVKRPSTKGLPSFVEYVVVLALGDLVAGRHSVRGLEGAAQRFIIKFSM